WTANLGEISSGDYLLQGTRWNTLLIKEKNAYVWAPEIYEGTLCQDWDWNYRRLYYANRVLDGLEELDSDRESPAYQQVKGTALFFRGWVIFNLAQQFCKPYHAQTASTDPGIPLRLEADITRKTG